MSYSRIFKIEGGKSGRVVFVEFKYHNGSPQTQWEPEEPPEIEIVSVSYERKVTLVFNNATEGSDEIFTTELNADRNIERLQEMAMEEMSRTFEDEGYY
jgi:hypothetical protein